MFQCWQNHWKTIDADGALEKNINHSIALTKWPSNRSMSMICVSFWSPMLPKVCHQYSNFDKIMKLYLWVNIYSSDWYCIARMQCSLSIKIQLHTNHKKGFRFWWKLRVLQCLECVLQCVGFNVEAKNISQHWEPGARQPGGNPGKGGQANGQWPPLLDSTQNCHWM